MEKPWKIAPKFSLAPKTSVIHLKKMIIDILFVHPNASEVIYQDLAKRNSAIEPPIWAGMLANSVRSSGGNPAILDAEAENLDFMSCAKKIHEIKARIVCFVVYGQQPSASSQNMEGAVATAKEFKNLDPTSFILFVGGMCRLYPLKPSIGSFVLTQFVKMKAYTLSKGLLRLKNLTRRQ